MFIRLRDGSRVRVLDTGPASMDSPYFLLHGFTGSSEAWGRELLDGLAAARRVIAIDLPGHGGSDAPSDPRRYAFAALIADLADVLEALDVPRAVWVGYSMGGRLALGAGLLRPEKVDRLVLESASPGLEAVADRRERQLSDEALARLIEAQGMEAFVNRWERQPLFASQRSLPGATRDSIRARRLANRPDALAACLRGLGTGMQPSLWDALAHVDVPTLLLSGALDRKFVRLNERMDEMLPEGRLQVVPDVGHAVHLEDPSGWLSRVRAFAEDGEGA